MGMSLDVFNGGIGLPDVEFMKIVVVNTRHLRRGFASNAFPLVQVADLLVFIPIGFVKFREPGMGVPTCVVVYRRPDSRRQIPSSRRSRVRWDRTSAGPPDAICLSSRSSSRSP